MQGVDSATDEQLNSLELIESARNRLRAPILVCQILLTMTIVFTVIICVSAMLLTLNNPMWQGDVRVAYLGFPVIFLLFAFLCLGLHGLKQAAQLKSLVWAWFSLILISIVGIIFIWIIPFILWSMVILIDPQTRHAFRLNRTLEEENSWMSTGTPFP